MTVHFRQRAFVLATAATLILLTTGCGVNSKDMAADVAEHGASISGTAFGGQQPIYGAHIYLFAAGTTGYGVASKSLINANYAGSDSLGNYVTTDSVGSFNLTGTYSCTPGQQVYLLSYGGNPGLTSGTNNTALVLAAVLGNCPTNSTFAGHISYIKMNEISTVAAAFSMAGYTTDFQHVSSPNTTQALAGIANAFATSGNLVSLAGGGAYATTPAIANYGGAYSANGTVSQLKINTLADILAACVNSTSGSSTACSTLFTNTTYTAQGASSQTVPSNTFDAMLSIAKNPGNNISNLFGITTTTAPFNPQLQSAPNDWAMIVKFSAPNLNSLYRSGVDAQGNIWIANNGNNSLVELSPLGAVMSGSSGYSSSEMNGPFSLAFDQNGNTYVANGGNALVSVFNSSGVTQTSGGYAGNSNNANSTGYSVSIDNKGEILYGGDKAVDALSSSGSYLGTSSSTTYNTGIRSDSKGNFWWISFNGNTLTEYVNGGLVNYSGGGLNQPFDLAMDSSGGSWTANYGNSTVSHFNSDGSTASSSGYSGGGVNQPLTIAVDGQNVVWVGNGNGTITQLSSSGTALSPSTGYSTAITNAAGTTTSSSSGVLGVTPDPAGNLWVMDSDNSIYEFVGLSAPVNGAATASQAGVRP